MPDESHQMQDHKMKFRWRMACIDKSGIDKSGRTVWGRAISGKVYAGLVLAALFVAIIGMDYAFIGHKPALACCYDPPEPVIEPDPVAPSAPASDSQEEVAAPADSATQSTVNAPQDKQESDPLPANLYSTCPSHCPSGDRRWSMVKGSGNCLSGTRKAGACP